MPATPAAPPLALLLAAALACGCARLPAGDAAGTPAAAIAAAGVAVVSDAEGFALGAAPPWPRTCW